MRIREQRTIESCPLADQQELIVDAIDELRQQYRDGEISTHAYGVKMRALMRML